ncbi:MAG: hypothetical protein J7499_03755 [Sphingopyxis sp.]|nr:hypothetical protein [Sphingopyxis sp.]
MKQEKIPPRPAAGRAKRRAAVPDYVPVPLRRRHDGWTPDRQLDFIEALAETACVTQAAKAVGLAPRSAYRLRANPDAQAFRLAWDAALDVGVRRLGDAVLSRAVHGVARPIFYRGEQVGERIYYPERLAMWLLRLRDPERFGAWREAPVRPTEHYDHRALWFTRMLLQLQDMLLATDKHGTPGFPDPAEMAKALGIDPAAFAPAPDGADPADGYHSTQGERDL